MTEKDFVIAFLAVFVFVESVQSLYDPHGYDEQNRNHGNNFIADESPKAECPTDFTGFVAYAFDCRQFLNCWHGRGSVQSCPPGTMFNSRNLECDHPSKVKCQPFNGFAHQSRQNRAHGRSQRQQQSVQCERGTSGLFAHPYDCTKFLNCDHGRTFIQECGPGTMFNDLFKVCDWPHKVNCGNRQATGETFEESHQQEVHYGEGQMDVRSNFGAENINSHGRSLSSNDVRNQRRYPDPAQQSENNNFNGLKSSADSSFSSTANGQSLTSQNRLPSFDSSKSGSAFDSTLKPPQETQIVESTVSLSNAYGPINTNQLDNQDSVDRTKGRRTGRIDDIPNVEQNREFPTATHNLTLGFVESNVVDTSNVQQSIKVPDLQLLSPRVGDDFEKYFSNPKSKSEIPSPTTIRNVVMLDGEPVTKKIKTIYPIGFEKLGKRCDETGSGMDEHPSDCTKFVTCENGQMHVHSCDIGFSFNPTLKICDFAPNVPNCLYDSGITVSAVPVASEQDALNEIHDDERIEKTTAVNQFTQTQKGPYFIPDMSVLPLESGTNPSYPEHQAIPTERHIPIEDIYFGFGKPSRGGDVEAESLDEIVAGADAKKIEITTLRNGKSLHQNEIHDSTTTFSTTTEKQSVNIMRIPAGKEHVMPLYHRPTKPSLIITSEATATQKPHSPLQNSNQIYYQPFAKQSKDVEEPEQDYIPISDALKLLLRPYIARNATKATNETLIKEPIDKIENKLFDLMDNKENGQTKYNKSLEQDDLAAALLNENIAVKHLPVTTYRPENRIDVESVPSDVIEQIVQAPEPIPSTKPFNHHHPHHPPSLFHTSYSSFSPGFKHSPEFHKNHPHFNSNNNKIIFPGPRHDYNHPMHANRQGGVTHSSNHLTPPMMHAYHPNHNSNHHPPIQQLSNRHNVEQTTQTTASAPIPNQYPTKPTMPIRSGRFETNTNQNCEFSCGNGNCVQLRQLCDGRNDCGNRYDELHCPQVNYQVRLSNDKGHKHMGRIEVRAYGKWGYVCDDKFTITNANVLCRELGFNMGAVEVQPNSFYPPNANVPITESSFMMDEVTCHGNETSLKECDFDGWEVSDCNAEEVVGVVCKVTVMQCPPNHWLCQTSEECIPMSFMCDGLKDCSDGTDESDMHCKAKIEYRLMDGIDELEGRVEVKYRGVWGTVCDDDFGDKEANVFCSSLGFNGPATIVPRRIGMSTGPIWLDQVNCIGNETSLDKCMHFDWSESNCNHTEDVSVRCSHGSNAKSSRYLADEYALQHLTIDQTNEYSRHPRDNKHIPIPDYSNQCGRIKIADADDSSERIGQFRVISGSKTKRGHHPWQATIRARSRNGRSSHWCGAVIVSKNYILTAAHCLVGFPKGAYFVRLGDHHSEIYENSEIEIFIENWSIHEDFRKGQLMNNDIALIQLKQPIQFTNYIQPICLPTKETKFVAGKNCTISGWGSIQYGKSTPSLDLKAASVPLIAQEVCRRKEIYGDEIMDTMFCAGYLSSNGVDACDGDSGGPLVCANENGVNELYGIISWGQRCGDSTKPGVYVNVIQYLDWIKQKMNQMSEKR